MKITVVGTGYVGLVSATCFAETGHEVMGVDIDAKKIASLQQGIIPIYEPGLQELVARNVEQKRLSFTTDIAEGVRFADVLFSAVGTPPDKDHRADLRAVYQVALEFGKALDRYKIFVNKSTVPVGTGDECRRVIEQALSQRGVSIPFDVVSNPEFLREGAAVKDTLNPDRVVIGADSDRAKELMEKIYSPISRVGSPIMFTTIRSAEIIKYAANAFLATKISFINEIANFCEKAGGDVTEVAKGIGLDKRIGARFLHAGIGYGGSCFPKDIRALIQKGKEYHFDFKILEAVEEVNRRQQEKLYHRLKSFYPDLHGLTIAVWGLAFKPRTDDMRDAPSIVLIRKLLGEGAKVKAYDPVANEAAKRILKATDMSIVHNAYDALSDADALLIMTEWDEFRSADLAKIKSLMKRPLVIDGRNIWEFKDMLTAGFDYISIGRDANTHVTSAPMNVAIEKLLLKHFSTPSP